MKDREATRAIRELAERQHGVVARRQLVECGVGQWLNQGRVEAGLLIPVFQGVFALGHQRITREGRWMAAVLASGPGAVLSHSSAMALWGIRGSRGPVEVLRLTGGPRQKRPDIRLHQTRSLSPEHVTEERGIPATTIERTSLDMAGRLDAKQLERALVDADRSGRLRWAQLSPPEVDFLALCREFGLPLPQVNVLVAGFEVDFLWPAQRVVVEADSYGYHGDRPAFERDHQRTVVLTAVGYEVHRVTARMLTWEPETFINNVQRALQRCNPRTASTSLPARPRS